MAEELRSPLSFYKNFGNLDVLKPHRLSEIRLLVSLLSHSLGDICLILTAEQISLHLHRNFLSLQTCLISACLLSAD